MKPVSLLLGLHSHQPVDNFDRVVINAIENCYEPFFTELKNFPEFKVSVHFSGWLLDFIRTNAKDLFTTLQELAQSNTIEFLTGGYYEPVLCAIPSKDRKRQIKKLSKYIEKHFGQTPKGLWLTERVWESSIISDLKACGVEYVTVDDYHFLQSGVKREDLYGYYHTENNGDLLKLFPINESLRYILPFKPVNSVTEYVESLADKDSSKAAVIFDDGEKFGMWPGTSEWVYERGWLKEFFEAVLKSDKIETVHYCEYLEQNKPEGFVYLKENSYMEMGEWSLDSTDALKFQEGKMYAGEYAKYLKGGIWKNFITKYDESARIHKRVNELSHNALPSKRYKDALMRAQCNDVLWHGVFGGLYLPNLRDNAYKYIYMCEEMETFCDVHELNDNNLDGFLEAKMSAGEMLAIFDSKHGGQMTEFGSEDLLFNFQNTLTRRHEAYHENLVVNDEFDPNASVLVSEDGIDTIHTDEHFITSEQKKHLVYDWYTKNSFVDHISDDSFNTESFWQTAFKEHGDFANQPFEVEKSGKNVVFTRDGGIYLSEGVFPTKVQKKFSPSDKGIKFSLDVNSECDKELSYVTEFNFHFANYEDVYINNQSVLDLTTLEDIKKIELKDKFLDKKITIDVKSPCTVFSFPLYTVSQSEKGVDLTLQGISIALKFPLTKEFNISGSVKVV